MKYFLFLLIFFSIAACPTQAAEGVLATAESSDGRVRARLTFAPQKPRLSDTITLMLSIDADRTVKVDTPPFGTSLGELAITGVKEELSSVEGNRETKKITLTTTPKKSGSLPIWPIPISYTDSRDGAAATPGTLIVPPGRIEVASSVTPETASLEKIKPDYRLIDLRNMMSWKMILGITVLVVVVAVIFFLFRRKKPDTESVPSLTPKEIAMKRLDNLLESRLHESDVKKFFIELSGIVRWYIEQTSNIRAPELTTEEFLRTITTHRGGEMLFPEELKERLRLFLESADMVKFAKFQPTRDEIMLGCKRAREFF